MNTTHETKIAGYGAPGDTKAALGTFMDSFRSFRSGLEGRMDQYDQRIDTLTARLERPHLDGETKGATGLHSRAFTDYLRRGDESSLRGLDVKALSTSVDADGGYLVSPVVADRIRSTLADTSPMRLIASVAETQGASVELIADTGEFGADWVAESDPRAETANSQLEKITIFAHEISAMPKASQKLLDDAAFNVEDWIAGRVADKFSRAENAAFVAGNGTTQPKGFLSHTLIDEVNWSWGNIGYVPTGVDGDFPASNPSDLLIDLVYALKAAYRTGAVWLMNSRTAAKVRKMKDVDGQYLWSEGLQAGQPALLLGYRVVVAEDMPDIGSNTASIAFGNFKSGYTVIDHRDVRTLRDPFSAKPHVLFYTTKRVGGDVTDFDAIKVLKFGLT